MFGGILDSICGAQYSIAGETASTANDLQTTTEMLAGANSNWMGEPFASEYDYIIWVQANTDQTHKINGTIAPYPGTDKEGQPILYTKEELAAIMQYIA